LLGIESEAGTVEIGKRAKLVLLDANPLSDVKNIRKISGVFISGRWLNNSILNAMLFDLSKRNTDGKGKYD